LSVTWSPCDRRNRDEKLSTARIVSLGADLSGWCNRVRHIFDLNLKLVYVSTDGPNPRRRVFKDLNLEEMRPSIRLVKCADLNFVGNRLAADPWLALAVGNLHNLVAQK
jgi:hypothetical protein